MDAGGTHDPELIPAMLIQAEDWGSDLVIGSRFYWATPFLSYRTAISLTAAWLMRLKGVNVRDATSGFRVWRREWLQAALLRPNTAKGFAFQLELLYNAHRAGAKISEFPIPYRLTNSSFKWSMITEALSILRKME
jgi:dolichol-phosphate mannosyltransferase